MTTEQGNVTPSPAVRASNFADYEKLRAKQDGRDLKPDKLPDERALPEDLPPDKPESTPTGADNPGEDGKKAKTQDGNEDTGKPRRAEPPQDELPEGVKKRLARANRQRDKERERVAALEAEREELRQQLAEAQGSQPGDKPADKPKEEPPPKAAADMDTPIPEDQYDYDYPDESDYQGKGISEEAALRAFLEDVDRWDRNLPLKGGKYKGKSPGQQDKPADKPAQRKPPESQRSRRQAVNEIDQLFSDLHETLEEGEGATDTLAADFFDAHKGGRFSINEDMLRWLANNDEAVAVAQEFIARPRVANRIFRATKGHAKLLNELAEKLANPDKGGERRPAKQRRGGKDVPVPSRLRGSSPSASVNPVDTKDFGEYESARRQIDKAKFG